VRRAPWTLPTTVLAVVIGTFAMATEPTRPVEPFWDAQRQPLSVVTPGLDEPDPAVAEVRLGYFGPSDPAHPDDGDMWVAASLAVAEANAAGGYRGLPFRLVARWSDNPWTGGAAHVTRMVFQDNVWAIVGGPDGATTHLAEQVIAKTHLALVGPASTDTTVNLAGVPWMFSCAPSDELQAAPLATAIAKDRHGALAVVSATDHDSRAAWLELRKALLRPHGVASESHFEIAPDVAPPPELVTRLAAPSEGAVLILAKPRDAARLVVALRAAGQRGPIYGNASMGRHAFVAAAGPAAEGVVSPWIVDPESASSPLAQAFAAQTGHPPDFAALYTYDAVRLLVDAIRHAGLNRGRISEALRSLSPWQGASGTIEWDAVGQNRRPVRLGTIRDGRLVAYP
jgi:branched-chain amino acid transport system substrate-binding protein